MPDWATERNEAPARNSEAPQRIRSEVAHRATPATQSPLAAPSASRESCLQCTRCCDYMSMNSDISGMCLIEIKYLRECHE